MTFNPKAPPVYKPTSQKVAAPSIYRPQQANHSSAQLKPAANFRTETRPAPPVYRPQQFQRDLQPKAGNLSVETRPAPPVYRPQQRGIPVAQRKSQPAFLQPQSQLESGAPTSVGNGRQQIRAKAKTAPIPRGGNPKVVLQSNLSIQRATRELMGPKAGFPIVIIPRFSSIIQRMDAEMEEVGSDEEDVGAGVKVLGNLSEEQFDEIVGWGSKKGANDDYDDMADQIFSMRIDPKSGVSKKQKLASSVTGVIGVTSVPHKQSGKTALFLAQQSGKTTRNMEAIIKYLDDYGYYPIAMDDISGSPLHGEMTLIANMISKNIPLDILERVGVAGKKGCCQLCSGVLSKLGINYSHTNQSKYEAQYWADPWAKIGQANPYLTTKKKF